MKLYNYGVLFSVLTYKKTPDGAYLMLDTSWSSHPLNINISIS